MQDKYNRTIDYLRVSVTDRCNFRCVYCMPPEGVPWLSHQDILSYEEILRLIHLAVRLGVKKIRLTGGEPLVRKGIIDFVRAVAGISGIEDLSMTTNGSLLSDMAYSLKKAGLSRINISMDTADPERFANLTGREQLAATLSGIEKALAAGLTPVKINVALTSFFKQEDLDYFIDLVYRYPIHVRFIEYMPMGTCQINSGPTIQALKLMLNLAGRGALVAATNEALGNGPAKYYKLPMAQGMFGFITPLSEHFCYECTRLRLTADGKLKPCLLSDQEIDIKTSLRDGAGDQQLMQLLCQAVSAKPSHYNLSRTSGQFESKRHMSQIGG
jgi:cyclic pyranopterin phosphate synthase